MGAGASSTEVDAHLKRWEHAISDLSALCAQNRRELGTGGGGEVNSPDVQSPKENDKAGEEPEQERSLRRRASSLVSFNSRRAGPQSPDNGSVQVKPGGLEFLAGVEVSKPEKVVEKKPNRQAVQELHKSRAAVFKSYVDQPLHLVVGKLACDHFATVAIALSSLLGGHSNAKDRRERVTVEDVFFAAHVPLHLLHAETMHLTELYDVVREFVDVDNRFKGSYQVEVVHFDVAPTVGQVESGANEVGDRQTKVQLPEFRKQVQGFLDEDANTAVVVNYDPFVLEQDTLQEEDEDEDPEDIGNGMLSTTDLMASVMHIGKKRAPPRFTPNSGGTYGALSDCRNAVQFMVSLARGAATDRLHCEIEEVPLNSLFKAMARHSDGERAKGFLRITKKATAEDSKSQEIPAAADEEKPETLTTFFSPELCSGTVVGSLDNGTHASTITPALSPHLVAFAWALHFIHGSSENTHHYGRGLPVMDIIHTTQLPSDTYIECDLSIEAVYRYAKAYLTLRGLNTSLSLEMQKVATRISRDDAVPNISVFELESFLLNNKGVNTNPEAPNSVMMIQYNADVAHNVLGIATTSQWCILVGYDRDMQTATLIDANAKKFCATWTCPLDRLHKAVTNYGFLILSREEVAQVVRTKLDSTRSSSNTKEKKVDIEYTPFDSVEAFKTFPMPSTPFAVTVLAMSFVRVGITTSFDDIISTLPFQISAVLDPRLNVESCLILARHFLDRKSLTSKCSVKSIHFDKIDGIQTVPLAAFREIVKDAVAHKDVKTVAMQFHPNYLVINDSAKPFGGYGIITGFDAESDLVSVTDANPNRFFRTWHVTLQALHDSISILRHSGRRARGLIVFEKLDGEVESVPHGASRAFSLESVPLQNVFQTSPSAQVQSLSIAFAQLGHYYSPEELFYEAYLKTVNDQRRRGSQAYAWRDVEVSLAILNKKIDSRLMTLVARKFIESRKVANLTVEQLDEVEESDIPEILADCCDDAADHVILLNYDAKRVHKLTDMGSSVAIIKSFDPDTDTVQLMDCEFCLFGLYWSCDLKTLAHAADLENPGTSKFGFIKISNKKMEKRAGIGLSKSPNPSPLPTGEEKPREKLTTFVGGEGEL